jgi:hypothetical protein
MEIYRTDDGKLDRPYLRTCACYRLLMGGHIDSDRCVSLMREAGVYNPRPTVEIWKRRLNRQTKRTQSHA